MELQGSARSVPVSAAREGPSKPAVPQKNAYARLLQKHHSGRFRSYLHHIAQKLQLDESILNDSGSDTEPSLKRGLVREALSKNGVTVSSCSPIRTLQPWHPELVGCERPSETQEHGFSSRLVHSRDPSIAEGGEDAVEEGDDVSLNPRRGRAVLFSAGQVLVSKGMASRPGFSGQKLSSSEEKDIEELRSSKHSNVGCEYPTMLDFLSAGQFGMDLSARTPSQAHGELLTFLKRLK